MADSRRNQRNNPYIIDGLAVAFHRSAAGVLWRWRTELAILGALGAGTWRLAQMVTLTRALIITGGALLIVAVLPWSRRYLASRAWCLLARHRLQRLCYEARLHTRTGRLPLILWIRPTK